MLLSCPSNMQVFGIKGHLKIGGFLTVLCQDHNWYGNTLTTLVDTEGRRVKYWFTFFFIKQGNSRRWTQIPCACHQNQTKMEPLNSILVQVVLPLLKWSTCLVMWPLISCGVFVLIYWGCWGNSNGKVLRDHVNVITTEKCGKIVLPPENVFKLKEILLA